MPLSMSEITDHRRAQAALRLPVDAVPYEVAAMREARLGSGGRCGPRWPKNTSTGVSPLSVLFS